MKNFVRISSAVVWAMAMMGFLFAGYELLHAAINAESAPQQAAGAAMAAASAIIPYCLARGWDAIWDKNNVTR